MTRRSLCRSPRFRNPVAMGHCGLFLPVFKTGRAGQPPAWKVRFLRRVVAPRQPVSDAATAKSWLTTRDGTTAYLNALTARATTRPNSAIATVDWTSIKYLARWVSGMTSAGLNAVAFVNPRCR